MDVNMIINTELNSNAILKREGFGTEEGDVCRMKDRWNERKVKNVQHKK